MYNKDSTASDSDAQSAGSSAIMKSMFNRGRGENGHRCELFNKGPNLKVKSEICSNDQLMVFLYLFLSV